MFTLEVVKRTLHAVIGSKEWNRCDHVVQRASALGLLAVGLCRSGSAGLQHHCATRSSSGAMARGLALLLAALTVAADARPRPVRALALRGGS